MPKSQERYEFGELKRVRKNLGELSEEEARRMKEKLGGEVGSEKDAPEVRSGYQKMQERTLARQNPEVVVELPSDEKPKHQAGAGALPLPRMKFWDRFRLDWHLAGQDYRAKTRMQALSLFWNRGAPDRPNRSWILEADQRWFRSLENLSLAVRGLTGKQHKNALQSLRRVPLFFEVLRTMREWDVEAVGRELTFLQRNPGSLTFSALGRLAKLVLRPYYSLSALNPDIHIQAALAKIYDLDRMCLTSANDLERLRKYFLVARDEVPLVFPRLRLQFYPVLIKNLCSAFLPAGEFFTRYQNSILEHLDVPEADILLPGRTQVPLPLKREEVPEPTDEAKVPDGVPVSHPGRLAARGRDLAARLFPGAGIDEATPEDDDFAYFSPIFNFPRGAELIARDDPLLRVLSLALIVDQFFFGMENFRLSPAFNPTGANLSPVKHLDQIATEWRRFLTEVVSRRYLSTLQDYCRFIERGGRESPEARRNEEQLYWIRKNAVLPHEPVTLFKEKHNLPLGATPLFLLVAELNTFLVALAVDTEMKLKLGNRDPPVLLNPLEMFRFDIDSPLSRRLHSLFRKVIRLAPGFDPYADSRNNRTFLFSALAVVQYLDYLINTPTSPINRKAAQPLYRTIAPSDPTPVYNVHLHNTQEILVRATIRENLDHKDNKNLPVEDDFGDFYAPWIFQDELRRTLHDHQLQGTEGGLWFLRVWLGKDQDSEDLTINLHDRLSGRYASRSVTRSDHLLQLLWIGPTTEGEDALKSFVTECAAPAVALPVHAVWVPFQRSVSAERLSALGAKGLEECSDFPPQVFGVYDPVGAAWHFSEDVPLCAEPKPEPVEKIPSETKA